MTSTATPVYQPAIKSITITVPSARTPGKSYEVSVNPFTHKPMSCTCEARVKCWHQKAVAAGAITTKPRIVYGPVERTHDSAIRAARLARAAYEQAAGVRAPSVSDLYGD